MSSLISPLDPTNIPSNEWEKSSRLSQRDSRHTRISHVSLPLGARPYPRARISIGRQRKPSLLGHCVWRELTFESLDRMWSGEPSHNDMQWCTIKRRNRRTNNTQDLLLSYGHGNFLTRDNGREKDQVCTRSKQCVSSVMITGFCVNFALVESL